ncbi:MAG: hypothetical protein HC905_15470 [Bacteroidales bacterium]|nr:hypothetical protein [Bacteroidales bacterium]
MRISLLIWILLVVAGYEGLMAQKVSPELNKKIVAYVNSVMGQQVDRGECWDLAYQALNRNNAKWNGEYIYGKEIDPQKDEVFPGDIIQFEKVKVKYINGNTITTETMGHHTAIVYKVYKKGKYQLAHQNTGFSGRKVGLSDFELENVIKGKMKFYRPQPK